MNIVTNANPPTTGTETGGGAETKIKSDRERSKKRGDFPPSHEGYVAYCDYKKQYYVGLVTKYQGRVDLWEAKKAGKHVDDADKKLKRIEKLKAALAALEAEIGGTR